MLWFRAQHRTTIAELFVLRGTTESTMAASLANASTGSPLLATKLFHPKWRPGLVSRPRLVEQLNIGTEHKLILISAPAGFGKTTLLAEWLAANPTREGTTAWVSLDQADNEPALFWTYLFSALQHVEPGAAAIALAMLQSPQPPPIETILTAWINEMATVEEDFVVILDDYHVIEAQPIQDAIAFLLDHLPPRMHVVIATRSDPPLPLTLLRARAELTELRAADLRFTPNEAGTFLNDLMGLKLSTNDVDSLETRTEGWIAGLQLAALSMRGREDVSSFIRAFAGDHRYIVDYLVEEVLDRQTDRVRSFLLETSILERLTGSLCDAVTGREDGSAMLEALERGNLFVVPLDDRREWYRYHHLFADVLLAHAVAEDPERISTRHSRASEWYENRGLRAEAIRHALAAEDWEHAAYLVELAWRPMDRSRRAPIWLRWVRQLPVERIDARPVLSLAFAWALLEDGDLEAGAAQLAKAEHALNDAANVMVADQEEFESMPGAIAAARAYLSQALGDMSGTLTHARRALDLLPEDDHVRRGSPAALLAVASWRSGDLDAADRALSEVMTGYQLAGNERFAVTGAFVLAEVRKSQGRLHAAKTTYDHALGIATSQDETLLRGAADLYTGLSDLHRERNELDVAAKHLERSRELGEHAGLTHWRHRWCLARARLREADGDLGGALALLDEAERHSVRGPVPDVQPIAAHRARLWVAQGKLAEALGWLRERELSVDDDLSYIREFEHMTLARVLLERYRVERDEQLLHRVLGLLERLLHAAEEDDRTGSVIGILVLLALAHQARGDIAAALTRLERALKLAEPERFARTFLDEREPMRDLLRQAAAKAIGGPYAHKLLLAYGDSDQATATATPAGDEVIVPLTPRELEILRLIAAGMRNREIAEQLFISPSTVKRHIANTYGKLGVGHRTEALARANELNLF